MNNSFDRVRIEQRAAWLAGDRLPIEHFVQRDSSLGEDESTLLDLICSEILLRQDFNDPVDPGEYASRFPHLRERIEHLIAITSLFHDAADDTPFPKSTQAFEQQNRDIGCPTIPDIEIVRFLARGSWGSVYEGIQHRLNRRVAVKVLERNLSEEASIAYHRHESTAQARLNHPNIVQVYDSGSHEQCRYIVMEYIDGKSLAAILAEEKTLPPHRAATVLAAIADAVHFAHSAGVIHRDLKPANILMTTTDTPKIVDFGLARQIDAESITGNIAFVGTGFYMAPEMAAGNNKNTTGPGLDIFAMGVILHEMLTGVPPFRGHNLLETLGLIAQAPTPALEGVPECKALDTIRLGCLEKNPAARYPSAEAVARDCRLFLSGLPVLRKNPFKLNRRHILTLTAAATVPVIGLLAIPSRPPKVEDIRSGIMDRLRRNIVYELTDETGLPLPLIWKGREPTAIDLKSMPSLGTTRVELLDRHPCQNYRLTAEMRILRMPFVDAAYAGVYVAHKSPTDGVWAAITATYSEKGDPRNGGYGPTGKAVIATHLADIEKNFSANSPISSSPPFVVCGQNQIGDWRTIGITVQNGTASLNWQHAANAERYVGNGIPSSQLSMRVTELAKVRTLTGFEPFPDFIQGLGLLIHNCTLAVRNIRLEPISLPV